MNNASDPIDLKRRKFLLSAGIGGTGAIVFASGSLLPARSPDALSSDSRAACGYRASEHILNYYRTARV